MPATVGGRRGNSGAFDPVDREKRNVEGDF